MNKNKNNDKIENMSSVIEGLQDITAELNNKLSALVSKLIDLNIKQIENKISKKQAEEELEQLIRDHFALEEIRSDISNCKKQMLDSYIKQK